MNPRTRQRQRESGDGDGRPCWLADHGLHVAGAPTPPAPTKGMSLADCRPYGVSYAQVTLKLPGMVQHQISSLRNPNEDGGPRLAMRATTEEQVHRDDKASATLFDGPTRTTPHWIQNAIYVANSDDVGQWDVKNVDEAEITLSAIADTGQATDISHPTFTTHHGAAPATFDYWAFTSSGQRYLLSYARLPTVKTPDPATFFATATSCPESS